MAAQAESERGAGVGEAAPKGNNDCASTKIVHLIKRSETFCRRSCGQTTPWTSELPAPYFSPDDGISGYPRPHLRNLKAKNRVAHLDRLSVRCLSNYLTFALIFDDK